MKKKGFTLVELLAVIAILAILVIVAMPNVIGMFNQAKQNSFENGVKSYFKTTNSQYFATGELVYSNVVEDAAKLNMDGEELDYYIELDTIGNIKIFNITNGEYKIEASGTSSNPIKLEQIGDSIKVEVAPSGEKYVMSSNGDISGNTTEETSRVVENLNIKIERNDFFRVGQTIMSYDSSTQTPEQFFTSTMAKTGDMDVNYYKLSNTMAGDRTQYYINASINGTKINELLYGKNFNEYGTTLEGYSYFKDGEFSIPFLISTNDYNYTGSNYTINFTKGLWFVDFLGSVIRTSEYLTIKEAVFTGKEKTINGINYVKISNETIVKENLLGKQLTIVANGLNGAQNYNETITESLITEIDSNIIVDNILVVVPNDGIYANLSVLISLFEATIKTN